MSSRVDSGYESGVLTRELLAPSVAIRAGPRLTAEWAGALEAGIYTMYTTRYIFEFLTRASTAQRTMLCQTENSYLVSLS